MKNVLKKNQIMITALAIMIAVAGYLNFAGTKLSDEELMNVSGQSVIAENGEELTLEDGIVTDDMDASASLEISDEDLELADGMLTADGVLTTENGTDQTIVQDIESLDTDDITASADYLNEEMTEVAQGEVSAEDTPGEAVFTSSTNVTSMSGAKLMKEQTRAKNRETLLNIINSTGVSEQQKQSAIEGMIQLTDIAEKETAAEILLEAKGFEDVVVSISETGVDVVVSAETLTDAQCAQIEDIVTRKTGTAPENIIIQCSK